MTTSPPEILEIENFVCPDCQAEVTADASACWLCYRTLTRELTCSAEPPLALNSAGHDALMTFLAVIAVVVVAFGLGDIAPGLAGLLVIIVAPALIVTSVRIRRRARTAGPLSTGQKATQFVVSAAMVLATIVVLSFAAMIAFCIYCIYAMSGGTSW